MKELFSSNCCVINSIDDSNVVAFEWKKYDSGTDYRNSVLKLCDIALDANAEVIVINRKAIDEVTDSDMKWFDRNAISRLKKTKCKRIVFIVDKDDLKSKNNSFPFDVLSANYKLERVEDLDSAIELANKGQTSVVSDEILNMTKEDALKYLGLPLDSTLFAIDDKFWQITKRYRADNSPEAEAKLAELTAVYDIATGARDKREKEQAIYSNSKKYFGKTSDEWKNHFSYSWYKYLIAIILVLVAGNLIYNMFLKPRYDISVVTLGHMAVDTDVMEGILIDDMGFVMPYVNSVDVVPENDEGQTDNGYGEQTAATVLMSSPEIIITDNYCTNYYFNQYADCTNVYNQLATMLPPEAFAKLVPVYCSEREYQQLLYDYEVSEVMLDNVEEFDDINSYDDTKIMIGIMVEDIDFAKSFGFDWKWHYKPIQLVFSIGAQCEDIIKAETLLVEMLRRIM